MIRLCADADFHTILEIINDAAQAYRSTIPADRWQEPYMQEAELAHQIETGVGFWGYEENRLLKTYWAIPERQVETSVVLAEMCGHHL